MELLKIFTKIYMKRTIHQTRSYFCMYRKCSTDASINLSQTYHKLLRHKMKLFLSKIEGEGLDAQEIKYIPQIKKKHRADNITVDHFVDKQRIFVKAGNGGNGAISYLHLCFNEFAGMSGGSGGKGGHVLFKSSHATTSLSYVKIFIRAQNGGEGVIKNCDGVNSPNTIIEVPVGTAFYRDDKKICHLLEEGDIFIAARGGMGGKGNSFYTTDTIQRVDMAQHGGIGEEFVYNLQMQVIANVGLIGCPNAGKSTLLRALSRARPKVAPYAFTTLQPHIGVIPYEDFEQLRVADIPGLIEGSHCDKGLGIGFLRHVQRCQCLLYVIDMSQPDPIEQFYMLISELEHFSKGLSNTPHCLVANKIDAPQSEVNLNNFRNHFKDIEVIPISAKFGNNLRTLAAMMRFISDFKMTADDDREVQEL